MFKIVSMVVADVKDGFYILKSPDPNQEQSYKIKVGSVQISNGALIKANNETIFKLIVDSDVENEGTENLQDSVESDVEYRRTEDDSFQDSVLENDDYCNFSKSSDRHTWTYDETICLINSMSTHLDDLNHPKKRKFVFDNISNDMLSSGFTVSASFCQSKWKNLLRSYKTAKDNKVKTGRGPSRFHFFEKIDELLGEKPSNKCKHSIESSSAETAPDQQDIELEVDQDEEIQIQQQNIMQEETAPKRRKRDTINSSTCERLLEMKENEYNKRQKRHEERMAIQKARLEIEKEKMELLKKLN